MSKKKMSKLTPLIIIKLKDTNGIERTINLSELVNTAEKDLVLALCMSRLSIQDFLSVFDMDDILDEIKYNISVDDFLNCIGTDDVLNEITLSEVCDHYGEEEILDFLEYPHKLTDPMECLEEFKQLVSPRTYCDKEDLKKLVCDWIDNNMTHSIK